ncbi:hypothetical protein ABKN59_003154 [Abortiporus biennis]
MNVDDPYQYLPPDVTRQQEALSYVGFTVLGVWVWDSLRSIFQDYRLISKALAQRKRIFVPLTAYYISRLSTLAMIVVAIIFSVASIGNCQALTITGTTCASIAFTSSAFLFLPRTVAIFNNSRLVIAFLTFLWLSLFATSMLPIFGLFATTIGPTSRCILDGGTAFSTPFIQAVSLAIFDTLVFFLTSFRLISQTTFWDESNHSTLFTRYFRILFTARGLSRLSKSLLRGNQKYYFATVGLNITSLILMLAPKLPMGFHIILIVPVVVVQNMLACRVFSETLLDVTSVQEQRIELENQSPSQVQRDIIFADALWNTRSSNAFDSDDGGDRKIAPV